MTSQFWWSIPARTLRVWGVFSCFCALLLPAASAVAEPILVASYDSWQWNGFSRTAPAATAVAGGSVIPSLLADALPSAPSPAPSPAPSSPAMFYMASADSGVPAASDSTASISGYVYVDVNDNGVMDTSDWAISGAEIQLSSQGSTAVTIAYSKTDGSYAFTGLGAGTYSVTMLTPCCQPGTTTMGVLQDAVGNSLPPGTATQGQFSDITVAAGNTGTNYNFGELVYPIAAYSKRLLMDDNAVIHTVPEPGTLVLLAVGGLILGGFGLVRRRPWASR